MSLLPFVFRDMVRPLRMLEQQMRLADELFQPFVTPMIRYKNRPAIEYPENSESIVNDKEKFQVKLDVQHFTPDEITVKTADGNAIVVEGKHEEHQDDKGFISRQFKRRFVLSNEHNLKDVVSSLSSDGILTVTAPRKNCELQERIIPINHTGPMREEKKKEEKK